MPQNRESPYVCNGCLKKSDCRLDKYYYRASRAHKEYKTVLVESRAGINASEEEIKALDDIISPLVENGQLVYTILHNHPEITKCEKTIYNYIDAGIFSVRNMNLPKKGNLQATSISRN